ncbi:MAG: HDOD domain-containing protein [Pseudomonadota bacterium]
MPQTPQNLAQWVELLNEQEMPIFAHTAQKLAEIAENPTTSVSEFAQVILQDSAMTARVLRMANSVFYNPVGQRITTVSRAVVRLGFDPIRSMTLSIAMVDNLLQGKSQDRVTRELARAIHAAVQAKVIAVECGDESPEEIFIATLLYRLGNMVFWCFPYGMDEPLDAELELAVESERVTEKRVLGFSLSELTVALNREWHLSKLLEIALRGNLEHSRRARILDLAWRLVMQTEQSWKGEAVLYIARDIAALIGRPAGQTLELLEDNAQVARQTANDCGAVAAGRLIPQPPRERELQEAAPEPSTDQPDYELQLSILRELSAMLNERVDVSAMVSMVLEGIYRGLGMDRAWFALLSPTSNALTVKYALGSDREALDGAYLVEPGGRKRNIFTDVLEQGQARWVHGGSDVGELPGSLRRYLGQREFFLMPVSVGGTPRGLFYADRSQSRHQLDEQSFIGFKHFCEQAALGLRMLSQPRQQ